MRSRRRQVAGMLAVCAIALLSRSVQALPQSEVDDYFFDSNGDLQGTHIRWCNNSIYTDGVLSGTVRREVYPCQDGAGQCEVFCFTDCNCPSNNNNDDPAYCCSTGPVSCEESIPGYTCYNNPGCLCS